jgi:ABC-type ATPase with predicted acetyltransferase domain
MVSVGPGGAVWRDGTGSARRFLPLDRDEARLMVRTAIDRQTIAALGDTDEEAVLDLLEVLARAATAGDRIARITLNPTLVADGRAVAADVEVVLRRRDVDPLVGLRHI